MQTFEEGEDYYYDKDGRFVLTEAFLQKRGFCCHNNCRHCPYQKDKKADVKDHK